VIGRIRKLQKPGARRHADGVEQSTLIERHDAAFSSVWPTRFPLAPAGGLFNVTLIAVAGRSFRRSASWAIAVFLVRPCTSQRYVGVSGRPMRGR
jgi:hypothetical protein